MKRNASVRVLQGFIACWMLLAFLALSFAPACSDSAGNEQTEERCDFQGICVITYSEPATNPTTSTRACLLREETGKKCGDCWNYKTNDQKQLTEKTCMVCKLCNADFDCLKSEDCPQTAPFCQQGFCVRCRTNSDCDTERPFCHTGKCSACRKDSDCERGELPQCEDGICVACKCSSADKTKPYCLKLESDRSVNCVACLKDEHCKEPTPRCDTKNNVCIPFCSKETDCAPGEFCEGGRCLQCRSHSDCKDTKKPRCNQGVCQCSEDKDCPSDFPKCDKGACIQCTISSECPNGFPRCVNGECLLQLCSEKTQCTNPNYNRCQKIGPNTVCVGCLRDTDCSTNQTCDLSAFRCK